MSSLDAAVEKPFTLGNYLGILLELVTSKRLLVACFPSLRFIWDIFIQVNLNHSLPEMMYSWWLQVVWSVATLLHSWIWCFNLVLAHREYPTIAIVYTMNVCWFCHEFHLGMFQGDEVSFWPQSITSQSKKGHLIWDIHICRLYTF